MLDVSPHSLVVPASLLPATLLAHQRPAGASPLQLRMRLEEAGLLFGETLHPAACDVADVVADPDAIVQIRVEGRSRRLKATAWATQFGAVTGRPVAETHYELREVRRSTLTFHLGELLGLRDRPPTLAASHLHRARPEDGGLCRLIEDATTTRIAVDSVYRSGASVLRNSVQIRDAGALGYWKVSDNVMQGMTVGMVLREVLGCLPAQLDS